MIHSSNPFIGNLKSCNPFNIYMALTLSLKSLKFDLTVWWSVLLFQKFEP